MGHVSLLLAQNAFNYHIFQISSILSHLKTQARPNLCVFTLYYVNIYVVTMHVLHACCKRANHSNEFFSVNMDTARPRRKSSPPQRNSHEAESSLPAATRPDVPLGQNKRWMFGHFWSSSVTTAIRYYNQKRGASLFVVTVRHVAGVILCYC